VTVNWPLELAVPEKFNWKGWPLTDGCPCGLPLMNLIE
jgi:hypothetical protein